MNNMDGTWHQSTVDHILVPEDKPGRFHCRCLSWFLYDTTLEEATKQHEKHARKAR